jgi:S-DNA-T family DNA segregation ATPase FtsK/SpoIIIE
VDLVVKAAQGEAEVTLLAAPDDASLGDLVRHVTGAAPPRVCVVDGRPVTAATPLRAVPLFTGSTVSTDDDVAAPPGDAVVELVQLAGRGAGARAALSPGRYLIGPGSRSNAGELDLGAVNDVRFELDVADDGTVRVSARAGALRLDGMVADTTQGATTWTGGILDTGQRAFRLAPPAAGPPERRRVPGDSPTLPHNRPPRPAPPPVWEPPAPPEPVGARRAARAAAERFAAALADGRARELDRLRRAHPDPVEVAALARRLDPSLWQRRPGDPDALRFAVGLADLPWAAGSGVGGAADVLTARFRTLPMVPIVAGLDDHAALGVVGAPGLGRSIVRSVVLEAAVAHGPADLLLVVLTSDERAASWEWTKWLPHVRAEGSPAIFTRHDDVADWAARARSAPSTATLTLVVVDEPAWWRERTSPLRPLLGDRSLPVRWIITADASADLPAACATVVTAAADGTASVDYVADGGDRVDGVLAFHTAADAALTTARWLAALDDPDGPAPTGAALPDPVGLDRVAGAADPALVVQRWSAGAAGLPLAVGVGGHGLVEVDLVDDGPHALLVASTDHDLGELVQSALVALAAGTGPDHLSLALLADDPAVFGRCRELPHVATLVSIPDRPGAERVLRSLRAELARRSSTSSPADRPSLVVAIADAAVVGASDPMFAPSIVDIAARGPAVGVHLLLATAHADDAAPFAAVGGLRIARRLRADSAAAEALGVAAARQLPRHPRGRAVVRTRDGAISTVQSASTAAPRPRDAEDLVVRPFVVARERSAMEHRIERAAARAAALVDDDTTPLGRIVVAMTTAAAALAAAPHRPPVVEPLPDRLPLRTFFDANPGDGVPFALADLPDDQRQDTAWWRPGPDGHLLVYGAAGAGATSLLASLALGIAERYAPDDVHLYVLDADPTRNEALLAPLAAMPHCGGLVRVDDVTRLGALLRLLDDELERRHTGAGHAQPVIVLMVDDLAALRRAASTRRDLDGFWPRIERVLRDGASVGLVAVLTTSDARAVDTVAAAVPTRLVMRLETAGRSTADQFADADLGVDPGLVAGFGHGRALRLRDLTELQLVEPPADLHAAIAALGSEPAHDRPPRAVGPETAGGGR